MLSLYFQRDQFDLFTIGCRLPAIALDCASASLGQPSSWEISGDKILATINLGCKYRIFKTARAINVRKCAPDGSPTSHGQGDDFRAANLGIG